MHTCCTWRLRRKSVCTYTTSLVPTGDTKEIRDVLEVSGLSVVDGAEGGIAVTVNTRNGLWSGTLSRIARLRGATGRAIGLLLGLRALLGWTGHLKTMLAVFENEEAFASGDIATIAETRTLNPDQSRVRDWC
jgi:hypothetical protein